MSVYGLLQNQYYNPLPTEDTEWLINPDFRHADRVHDWRNHVPSDIINIWNDLSYETRLVVYFVAEKNASQEDWD